MRHLLLFSLILGNVLQGAPPVPFEPERPEWNPEGITIYRLIRMDEPGYQEPEAFKRFRAACNRLIRETKRMELPRTESRVRITLIEDVREILGDESYHILFDHFLVCLRNSRRLVYSKPVVIPAVDSIYEKYLPKDHANPLSDKLSGAGLAQLAFMTEFRNKMEANPETAPRTLLDLGRSFNEYLLEHGISGFGPYAESVFNRGMEKERFAEVRKQLRMARFYFATGAVCGALLLGAGHYGYDMLTHSAEQRLENVEAQRIDPQAKADKDAETMGTEFRKKAKLPLEQN